ncbi:MAG TPA: tetratricopeptide repeat protein [Chryseosolibacter sp.]|nr:tetratricopeptide repeat protein [Chryseosolibacter sp.]
MLRNLTFTCFLILVSTAYCQKIPLIRSGDVIDQAKILYDSGKYAEAIKEFYRVPERDTNYVLMLTEVALAHIAAEQYEEVLSICAKGLSRPSPYAPYFLKYQAIAEDKRGNFDKSVDLFLSAIRRYPADYSILYNLGITYYNNKKYENAAEVFFKVLSFTPYHAGSHLNLGRIAIGQGRKVHGMLSLGMYLSITPTDNARLVLLNNFLDNEVTDEGSIPAFGANEPEKLDQIVRAKMAMDKNFKSAIPVDVAVVRQYEMLFEQLGTIADNPQDPWIKAYLPIYRFIRQQNLMEPFIYHLLSSSANATAKKWISKNDKTLKSFFESVNTAIKKQRENVLLENCGYEKPVQAWYFDDNSLNALGDLALPETRRGAWKFFFGNHALSAEGAYDNGGMKIGIWKYYNNDGTVKSIEDYSTGEVTAFYPDGTKRERFFLKNDEIHGQVELYYSCGTLKEKLLFNEGKRHGKGESYYPGGGVEMIFGYENGEINGPFKSFYANGNVKVQGTYKDDKFEGEYRSYFPNKRIQSEGTYLQGVAVGAWSHYYSNGKLQRTGKYNDAGQPVGEWLYYDQEGVLTEKRQFDGEGRWHGANTHYYDNKLHYIDTYKKDVLVQSIFYDRDGKEIGKHGSSDGSFAVKNYFGTGQLQSEGNYRKGKAHGLWKYYNRFGKRVSEYNYLDGLLQGKATDYFASGEKKFVMEYQDNELHGFFQEFYRHGTVKHEGWFQKGNREQQWLSYYPDGTLESDKYYLLGSVAGPYYTYAVDGKLYSVETFENKLLSDVKNFDSKGNVMTVRKQNNNTVSFEEHYAGKKMRSRSDLLCGNYINDFTKWYPDGTVYFSYKFLNGKKHGHYIHNDITGKPIREGDFMEDQEEGLWKSYNRNGQVSNVGSYLEGLKDSVWNYYYPDGRISYTVRYREDKSHGVSRYYSPDGEPLLEKMYEQGDLIAFRIINENDENAAWQNFSGTETISVKNAAGKVVFEETYQDGLRHGYKRVYFDNGKLCEEYNYVRGDYEGPYSIYYRDGKVSEKGVFKNDEIEGKVETFFPDGTPLKVEHFRMGQRHGKAIYSGKGQTRKEFTFWDGVIE